MRTGANVDDEVRNGAFSYPTAPQHPGIAQGPAIRFRRDIAFRLLRIANTIAFQAQHRKLPPIHPGELLRDELNEIGVSLNELGRALRVPMNRISAIVNGKPRCVWPGISAHRRSIG